MKQTSILWIFIFFLLISCKKDKLEGDTALLIGTWNWHTTVQVNNYCEDDSLWTYTSVDSAYDNNNYSIEFLEKGKVKFYHNGGLLFNDRIVFQEKEVIDEPPFKLKFKIYLNNKESDPMEGKASNVVLRLYDFPKDINSPCEEYFNSFIID